MELSEPCNRRSVAHDAKFEEMDKMSSLALDYSQRVHRGVIKMSGYVEVESVKDEDWSYWAYLENSNREWDMIRLEKQHRALRLADQKHQEGKRDRPSSSGEHATTSTPNLSGVMAMVLTDEGEIIEVPVEYLEVSDAPPEEVNDEPEPMPAEEVERQSSAENTIDSEVNHPMCSELSEPEFEMNSAYLSKIDEPKSRANLRARLAIHKLRGDLKKSMQEDDLERTNLILEKIKTLFPFAKNVTE